MKRWITNPLPALTLIAGIGLTGCGDVTSGGVGEIEVLLVADSLPAATPSADAASPASPGPSSGTSAAPAPSGAVGVHIFGRLNPAMDSLRLEGTLTAQVRSFIRRERSNDWIEITDGPQEVVLALEGEEQRIVAQGTVPAGRYVGARTIFGRIEAEVIRGLRVDGEPIVGKIPVLLGPAGRIDVVEPSLFLDIAEGGSVSLAIEMNSRIWLRLTDRPERNVGEGDFRGAVRIRVHPGR